MEETEHENGAGDMDRTGDVDRAGDVSRADGKDEGSQHRRGTFRSIMEPIRESRSACREDLLRSSP